MPWIYHQASRELYHEKVLVTREGYAGKKPYQNRPEFQALNGEGPLPRGKYSIGAPFHHPVTKAYTLRLTPSPANNMFGRSGFLIHGDNAKHPGDSSDGCLVLPQRYRVQIWTSGDHQLEVVP